MKKLIIWEVVSIHATLLGTVEASSQEQALTNAFAKWGISVSHVVKAV